MQSRAARSHIHGVVPCRAPHHFIHTRLRVIENNFSGRFDRPRGVVVHRRSFGIRCLDPIARNTQCGGVLSLSRRKTIPHTVFNDHCSPETMWGLMLRPRLARRRVASCATLALAKPMSSLNFMIAARPATAKSRGPGHPSHNARKLSVLCNRSHKPAQEQHMQPPNLVLVDIDGLKLAMMRTHALPRPYLLAPLMTLATESRQFRRPGPRPTRESKNYDARLDWPRRTAAHTPMWRRARAFPEGAQVHLSTTGARLQ